MDHKPGTHPYENKYMRSQYLYKIGYMHGTSHTHTKMHVDPQGHSLAVNQLSASHNLAMMSSNLHKLQKNVIIFYLLTGQIKSRLKSQIIFQQWPTTLPNISLPTSIKECCTPTTQDFSSKIWDSKPQLARSHTIQMSQTQNSLYSLTFKYYQQ